MVVVGSDEKYFLSFSKFFTRNLNYNRNNFPDIDERDDHEYHERIGHESHNCESSSESERTCISEIELCGFDVEPQKSGQCCSDNDTDCWEEEEVFVISDKSVEKIILSQETACETIETICDIHTIRHSSDDQDTEDHIPPAYIDEADTRYGDTIVAKFFKKPPRTSKRKKGETKHLHTSTHSLVSTDISHIEIVIYSSEKSHREKCKKRQKCLVTIPESIVEIQTKWSLNWFEENSDEHHDSHDDEYHTSSHIGCPLFVSMECVIFCCFPTTEWSFGTNLFCEFQSSEKPDVAGSDKHSNKKSYQPEYHYPQNIVIHKY